jgi:hypothetical protein
MEGVPPYISQSPMNWNYNQLRTMIQIEKGKTQMTGIGDSLAYPFAAERWS